MSTNNSSPVSNPGRRLSLQLGATSAAAGMFAVKEFAGSAEASDWSSGSFAPSGPTTTPFVVALPVYAPKTPASVLSPATTPTP